MSLYDCITVWYTIPHWTGPTIFPHSPGNHHMEGRQDNGTNSATIIDTHRQTAAIDLSSMRHMIQTLNRARVINAASGRRIIRCHHIYIYTWLSNCAKALPLCLGGNDVAHQPSCPNSTTRTPATDMYNTTNGHHQRTSSQFYNKFTTSQCQSPTSRHVKMLGCGKSLSVGDDFVVQQVVELL